MTRKKKCESLQDFKPLVKSGKPVLCVSLGTTCGILANFVLSLKSKKMTRISIPPTSVVSASLSDLLGGNSTQVVPETIKSPLTCGSGYWMKSKKWKKTSRRLFVYL